MIFILPMLRLGKIQRAFKDGKTLPNGPVISPDRFYREEYDEVLNSQRDRVYTERRRALVSDNLQSLLIEYAELTMDDILEANIGSDAPKDSWDLEKLIAKILRSVIEMLEVEIREFVCNYNTVLEEISLSKQ